MPWINLEKQSVLAQLLYCISRCIQYCPYLKLLNGRNIFLTCKGYCTITWIKHLHWNGLQYACLYCKVTLTLKSTSVGIKRWHPFVWAKYMHGDKRLIVCPQSSLWPYKYWWHFWIFQALMIVLLLSIIP